MLVDACIRILLQYSITVTSTRIVPQEIAVESWWGGYPLFSLYPTDADHAAFQSSVYYCTYTISLSRLLSVASTHCSCHFVTAMTLLNDMACTPNFHSTSPLSNLLRGRLTSSLNSSTLRDIFSLKCFHHVQFPSARLRKSLSVHMPVMS